jgi:hypothetical protein
LAGLIDGDGYIYERPNGLFSVVITFDIRDKFTAEMVQKHLGGNLNIVTRSNAIRYKLHDHDSIFNLINKLNGLIRTKNRIEQFKSACLKYGVAYKEPIKLEYDNAPNPQGWFSGFFDSDGHVMFNKIHGSIIIAVTQKNKDVLDLLASVYNGKVYSHSKNGNSFRFTISSKKDVLFILDS